MPTTLTDTAELSVCLTSRPVSPGIKYHISRCQSIPQHLAAQLGATCRDSWQGEPCTINSKHINKYVALARPMMMMPRRSNDVAASDNCSTLLDINEVDTVRMYNKLFRDTVQFKNAAISAVLF